MRIDRINKENEIRDYQNMITNEQATQTIKKVFLDTKDGKEVLDFLLNYCMIFKNTYSSDPMEMAFKDGVRSVGLRILSILELDSAQTILDKRLKEGLGKWKRPQTT